MLRTIVLQLQYWFWWKVTETHFLISADSKYASRKFCYSVWSTLKSKHLRFLLLLFNFLFFYESESVSWIGSDCFAFSCSQWTKTIGFLPGPSSECLNRKHMLPSPCVCVQCKWLLTEIQNSTQELYATSIAKENTYLKTFSIWLLGNPWENSTHVPKLW